MKRIVEPELLDALPPDDPSAIRSRQDLRRVNAWMRNHELRARALKKKPGWSCARTNHRTRRGRRKFSAPRRAKNQSRTGFQPVSFTRRERNIARPSK